MSRKVYLVPAVLSLACVLVVADSAHAQRRGGIGIGGGNYGGYRGGYGGYGGNYGGIGNYGGYGYGNNSWQSYVAPFVGGGYGSGYYGGGYGQGYGGYNSPYYSGYRSGYYVQPAADYYAPSYSNPGYSGASTQTQQTSAQIRVILPDAQARVWFDGNATQQTGTERWFYTPSLQAGANNSYRIRATWMQAGREVTQERVVNVNPGQSTSVEFNQTGSEPAPLPGKEPAPLPGKIETKATTLDGRVLRTGPDHFVIQSANDGEITVYTNPQTRYTLNNNPGAFTDIRVGNNVNFGYIMQGDRRFANTITIRP